MKTGLASECMTPKGVILDAELTLDTPQRLWLSSGIRALDHAVETLYRCVFNLMRIVIPNYSLSDPMHHTICVKWHY